MLPAFLSVADDPTLKELNGVRLSGSYDFDDEGVPASRVQAVDHGVLKNFLMSRMPLIISASPMVTAGGRLG